MSSWVPGGGVFKINLVLYINIFKNPRHDEACNKKY